MAVAWLLQEVGGGGKRLSVLCPPERRAEGMNRVWEAEELE